MTAIQTAPAATEAPRLSSWETFAAASLLSLALPRMAVAEEEVA
jgi:hypothetical protein